MTEVIARPGAVGAGPGTASADGRGEAGRRGDDVRSDLHVVIERKGSGDSGIDLTVESKVDALYGDAIRTTVLETLDDLGVEDVRVTVEDQGALPWVIAARTEAAARAAGLVAPDREAVPCGCATVGPRRRRITARHRLRRSRLYLPGNEPKFMINAALHRPDGVILDLEDSVHPASKAEARLVVRNALCCVDFGDAERMVRINQLPLGLDDLDAIVPEAPDLILIPKVESPHQVEAVAMRIREIQALRVNQGGGERDWWASTIWLMPILESALGLEHGYEIATASETVVALTIGLEDYTADLGVAKTKEGTESLWARRRLVNAARAAGVQAIDSVYGDVQDEAGLRAWGRAARAMGFTGMGCVHPRQVRVIHEAFAPTAEELDRAVRIVDAFREAEEKGLGVVSLGSKMIDAPVVLRARRLVEQAREMGLLESDQEPAASDRESAGGDREAADAGEEGAE
jgi:citrate lyase subunit beta/citryl-CoA lyase